MLGVGTSATEDLEVRVMGTFRFWAKGSALPAVRGGSQRLLALLGLRDRALTRASVAGTLWPEASEDHAYSSLRSALGRLSRLTRDAVVVTPIDLCLTGGVIVDIRECRALAHRVLDPGTTLSEDDLSAAAVSALSVDVLPDWYDDWVLAEAEEWRQLRLHALEALSQRLLVDDRFGEATGAALAAVRAEPLRESSRAAVIRVHLAEGNQSDALKEFARYRAMLQDELGLDPTSNLQGLVADLQGR
jgi:DNA-binding SARP family transcriptional activator